MKLRFSDIFKAASPVPPMTSTDWYLNVVVQLAILGYKIYVCYP
jgi:hypothetical protein